MDIEYLQKRIVYFAEQRCKKEGIEINSQLSYIHLTEEVGEIAKQLINKEIRKDLYDENNLREEICDVILEALVLANEYGINNQNLGKSLDEKIDRVYEKHKIPKQE